MDRGAADPLGFSCKDLQIVVIVGVSSTCVEDNGEVRSEGRQTSCYQGLNYWQGVLHKVASGHPHFNSI